MKALQQIKERDYLHGLKGRTLLYGIAFRNKKPTVLSERVVLRVLPGSSSGHQLNA